MNNRLRQFYPHLLHRPESDAPQPRLNARLHLRKPWSTLQIVEGGDAGPARATSRETWRRRRKAHNPRGNLGARANFLAEKNAGEGVTRNQAVQGVTFDAGPTRTWVRGRGTGQLGRRPLSRLGPKWALTQPTIWGETIRRWPSAIERANMRALRAG